ncbi:MAG: hypothetical protein GX640_12475 [Fibrobacter sp.]|nr:hypothetical protein [Fibrobacter sp.]
MLTSMPLTVTYNRIATFNKLNENKLGSTLINLASGSKVRRPEDNIPDYFRAKRMDSQAQSDNRIGRDISEGLALLKVASNAGETVLRGVYRMSEITDLYYKNNTDDDTKVALKAEFESLKNQITSAIDNSTYDGMKLINDSSAAPLKTISLDNQNVHKISISFSAEQITDVSALSLGVDEVQEKAAVDEQLKSAGSYVASVNALSHGLNAQYNLVSRNATVSSNTKNSLIKTDTGNEMLTAVNRSIQHQSSLALMAQANLVNSTIVRLFG